MFDGPCHDMKGGKKGEQQQQKTIFVRKLMSFL